MCDFIIQNMLAVFDINYLSIKIFDDSINLENLENV
jgi:hypothetical protein